MNMIKCKRIEYNYILFFIITLKEGGNYDKIHKNAWARE
jgi:hypothetical protein